MDITPVACTMRFFKGDITMEILRHRTILPLAVLLASPAFGQEVSLRYTWMLPKTVIDATIVYTFDGCKDGVAKVKIAPTLVARTLPDPLVGQLKVDTRPLVSFWQDKSISIQTFANSRIISSAGSSPTGQGAQIIGNILGGIVKVAGLAIGLPGVVAEEKGPPKPVCEDQNTQNTGPWVVSQIETLKKNISDAQLRLANGEADADQKKDAAAVQAAQTLITTLQEKVALTVKTTIDPGVSKVEVDLDSPSAALPVPDKNDKVAVGGLVASICLSKKQLENAKWFSNVDAIFVAQKGDGCLAFPSLKTNIYLDFPNAHSTEYDQPVLPGPYAQTQVNKNATGQVQYRDVAYIPVLVWRGDRPKPGVVPPQESDSAAPQNPFQISAPQMMVFGQFGVAQSLDLTTDAFKSLTWEVDFQEDGQVTKATFSSKAWGQNMTSLLGNVASSANSIATAATGSSSTQASILQGQADLIYQAQRLQICQTTPASCPSK